MTNFLLLLGVSGVGKSSIIRELSKLDSRFIYIKPYTTRPLRKGEMDKIHIDDTKMDIMSRQGQFLAENCIYGIRYATPRGVIEKVFARNDFPVLDWPLYKLRIMHKEFPGRLYVVYLLPPNLQTLKQRLSRDGRDQLGRRFRSACVELLYYHTLCLKRGVDFAITSEEGNLKKCAMLIYERYMSELDEPSYKL